jgi:hypothetical protein
MNKERIQTALLLASLLAVSLAAVAQAKDMPKESHDGLVLQEHSKMRAVYLKPGATLDQYTKVMLLDCYVAFKKNWQRDYNENEVGLDGRITDADVAKIKKSVAEDFKKVFTKELETKGGYEIVTSPAKDVLLIRPAIINLIVTAPDTMTAGMTQNFVSSAGEMTLYMELYDSVTGDIIARVIDPEADRSGTLIANSVTNTAAADLILKKWADTLRSHLGSLK